MYADASYTLYYTLISLMWPILVHMNHGFHFLTITRLCVCFHCSVRKRCLGAILCTRMSVHAYYYSTVVQYTHTVHTEYIIMHIKILL